MPRFRRLRTDPKPTVEAFAVNTTGGSVGREIERVCVENELVITTWSPIHLRTKLKELYWKEGQPTAGAMAFWEDTLRYLYLPRLKERDVLAQAIRSGAVSRDFFGTAYDQHDNSFDGFQLGSENVQLDDTLLLIDPEGRQAVRGQPKQAGGDTARKRRGGRRVFHNGNEWTGVRWPGPRAGHGCRRRKTTIIPRHGGSGSSDCQDALGSDRG